MYVSPLVATPLMLPNRPSLSKAWPAIPPHFVPASDIIVSTYRLVLLLFGHTVGHWQGVCSMSIVGLDVNIASSTPALHSAHVHLVSGTLGHCQARFSTAQWKSVKKSGYLATRPNLDVNRTCRGDLAASIFAFFPFSCVHVRWSDVILV